MHTLTTNRLHITDIYRSHGEACQFNNTTGGHDCSDLWYTGEPNDDNNNEDCGEVWWRDGHWVLNDDTQYKKGDYVDLHETDTIVTPKVVEVCKKAPESKLSEIKKDIMSFAKKDNM